MPVTINPKLVSWASDIEAGTIRHLFRVTTETFK